MVTECESCPLRELPIFSPMSESELDFMRGFKSGELVASPGTTLMMEGSNSPQLYTVLEGIGLRYKTLPTGERQVVNFVLPGDFIGLQAAVMGEMQHSVEATTDMRLCVFDRKSLWELFRDHPGRAYDLTWVSAVEEHFLGESLAMIGQMTGIERVARAFVRWFDRCAALGLTTGESAPLPFRQQDLADAVGLSLVHTNKMLKRLRGLSLADWKDAVLTIRDYESLCEVALVSPEEDAVTRPLI